VGHPSYTASDIQLGSEAANKMNISTPTGTVATFHTHLKGSAMPSTPNNNSTGKKDAGDSLKAFGGHDVFVISPSGLSIAPSKTTRDRAMDGLDSRWIVRSSGIDDLIKNMQKQCATAKE
jgi:hypothetical protein